MHNNKKEVILLFFGDILLFLGALWFSLFLRYLELPSKESFTEHAVPFMILFVFWVLAFYIAGLYDKRTRILKSKLPGVIFGAQTANSIIAVLFFYLIPYFGITPKTILFIDLIVSFVFIAVWRIYFTPYLGLRKKQKAVLIGSGPEMKELWRVVNGSPIYGLEFITSIDLDKVDGIDFEDEVLDLVYSEDIETIVIDLKNEKVSAILPRLYNLLFSKIQFIDQYRIYEDIFDQIPLSLIGYSWFLENISSRTHLAYDILKRMMDIGIAGVLALVTLPLYPFVWLAIKLDDGGPLFIVQDRVGEDNRIVKVYKFRTMSNSDKGKWVVKNDPRITRVGSFLRTSRIDELPQLWNVIRGDMSLVGPRPELPNLVKLYSDKIPYYNIRHLIKPGLSGWAQIHHEKPPHSTEETREKLSYDLYYIKNRSFILDLKIALKTIRTLLSRTGV